MKRKDIYDKIPKDAANKGGQQIFETLPVYFDTIGL